MGYGMVVHAYAFKTLLKLSNVLTLFFVICKTWNLALTIVIITVIQGV